MEAAGGGTAAAEACVGALDAGFDVMKESRGPLVFFDDDFLGVCGAGTSDVTVDSVGGASVAEESLAFRFLERTTR